MDISVSVQWRARKYRNIAVKCIWVYNRWSIVFFLFSTNANFDVSARSTLSSTSTFFGVNVDRWTGSNLCDPAPPSRCLLGKESLLQYLLKERETN